MTRSYTQEEFDNLVWKEIGGYEWLFEPPRSIPTQSLANYLLRQFCDHWGEISTGGWKMRWQKEKTFNIKRRLNTWIENSKTWNKGIWEEVNKNPKGLKAPVIHRTPQQIQESKDLELGYERLRNRAKIPIEPMAPGVWKRKQIKKREESKKQSEQKYTDYE